jgi:antitoxin component of MazEF toxin-antitoxin module
MKIGKLCTVGDSTGIVIARDHLEQLGWFKGDQLQQVVLGDELVIRNLTERSVRPARTPKEWGDDKLSGARSSRQIRSRSD